MKRFRFLLLAAGAVAALLLVAGLVVFSSTFQTWAARRALAARPDWRVTIGKVEAGLGRVALKDVRYASEAAVLTLPVIEAELPVWSALYSDKVIISRLVAKGWTLDVSQQPKQAEARPPNEKQPAAPAAPAATAVTPQAVVHAFRGVFGQLHLPVDLSLDGVQLEGDVQLPERRGQIRVAVIGGGLRTGAEGSFEFTGDAMLADPEVNRVTARGTLVAAMDSPRSFSSFGIKLDAHAQGARWPKGVSLTSGATAARASSGETYSARIVANERQVLGLKADFPRDASRLDGTWKLDVRDLDVAPFALGEPLPSFTLTGEGAFDADAAFGGLHVSGRIAGTLGRLEVFQSQLAAVGAVKVAASFDVAQHGDTVAVQQFEMELAASGPVATTRALQPFQLNPETGEFIASDPAREIAGVVLHGVPLAWLKPYVEGLQFSGGDVRGEFAAAARPGGGTLRSRVPLTVEKFSLGRPNEPWVRELDLSMQLVADLAPRGWQLALSSLSLRSEGKDVALFDGKLGQLRGGNQSLKSAGKLTASIPALLRQPLANGLLKLGAGEAHIEFAASLGEKKEVLAKVALRELATTRDEQPVAMPTVSADVRADVAPSGMITLSVPLALERGARKSDLALAGTLDPIQGKTRKIEAQITSDQLYLEDAELIAGLLTDKKTPRKEKDSSTPPWRGIHGSLGLQLKKVVYSDSFELNNVAGRLHLDANAITLETAQLGLGETGRATLEGAVTFDAALPQPFGLNGTVTMEEFDPGPLLLSTANKLPAVIEGKFDVAGKFSARAGVLRELLPANSGTIQLTSRGGIFRGLPISVGNAADSTSTIAALIASASSMIGGITGRKDNVDITTRSQAVGELAKNLSAIAYDQLSFTATRDDAQNYSLSEFSLIAPEVRLRGSGHVTRLEGSDLAENSVVMEYGLRARGRTGDLLRYLGLLEPQADDFGYAGCTVPISISGTLGGVDGAEASRRLAAAAFEKAGFIDKATEWLAKPRNGKPVRGVDSSYDPGK